jgi:enamine deaminase RidA (YjgF/YER057c/UK114 family)
MNYFHGGIGELYITAPGAGSGHPQDALEMLRSVTTAPPDWQIARQTFFGITPLSGRSDDGGEAGRWPVTLLSAGAMDGPCPGGTHIQALHGANIRPLALEGCVSGVVFEDAHVRYCQLGGLQPQNTTAPRGEQTLQVFEQMARLLAVAGMDFSHLVRTWFYLDHILDWYAEFNRARDAFFTQRRRPGLILPASTGIGAKNSLGSALIAEALAIQPKSDQVILRSVPSPLQGSACDYGSSFSRAVEICAPDHTRLFVSGTASIARDGRSAHRDDIDGQVHLTMSVVKAILESRGLDWEHAYRAFAYFKHAGQASALDRYCTAAGITLPVVLYENDVCRPELLYEIELDAIKID